jgi:hypothetical protein
MYKKKLAQGVNKIGITDKKVSWRRKKRTQDCSNAILVIGQKSIVQEKFFDFASL